MATLTIRLPNDKHERLKELARSRNMSVNKLVEELQPLLLQSLMQKLVFELWQQRVAKRQVWLYSNSSMYS